MSALRQPASSAANIGKLDIKLAVNSHNHVIVTIPTTANSQMQSILEKIVASP
jgi:hypothetical protein